MQPPLVLLPGTLCDAALWQQQIAALGDGAQIAVGDLGRDDSIAAMARSILAAAPPHFALAGLSLGGIVAFEIVRQAPARVLRLALLDTNPRPPSAIQLVEWSALAASAHTDLRATVEQLLPMWLHPVHRHKRGLVDAIVAMAERVGAEAYLRQLRALASKPDSRGGLAQIACPTLVLVGRQDALCPPELHVEMAAAIPNARLAVIEHCGHLSSLEQPHAVSAELRHWLA